MDFRKNIEASKRAMTIGIGLVVIGFLLQLAAIFMPTSAVTAVFGVYGVLMLPAFFVLYAWTGYDSHRHGLDQVGAGVTAMLAYLVTTIVSTGLTLIGLAILWGKIGMSSPNPAEAIGFSGIMAGTTSITFLLVSVALTAGGMIVNFVVGAGGAALADVTGAKKKK